MTDTLVSFRNRILVTDVRDGLAKLPDGSIDCVVTSPPYWGLRDYDIEPQILDGDPACKHRWGPALPNTARETRTADIKAGGSGVSANRTTADRAPQDFGRSCSACGAWEGCFGLEPTLELFLQHLLFVFDEVRRVLKPSGTCWVNLGDCYRGGFNLSATAKFRESALRTVQRKSLCLVPHRFAIGMLERGWILRNHVIWHKPNCLPQPFRDRLTNTWDHLFFFVKAEHYYFDLDAIRVPHRTKPKHVPLPTKGSRMRRSGPTVGKNPGDCWHISPETRSLGAITGSTGAVKVPGGSGWTGHVPGGAARIVRENDTRWLSPGGKNPGDFWEIPTRPSGNAHFATFPEGLVEMPIRAGCPPQVCNRCGLPKRDVRRIPANPNAFDISMRDAKAGVRKLPGKHTSAARAAAYDEATYASREREIAISTGCRCRRGFRRGIVLDPFMGSGTVAVVARRFERDFIGFEVKESYAKIAHQRLRRRSA